MTEDQTERMIAALERIAAVMEAKQCPQYDVPIRAGDIDVVWRRAETVRLG